MTIKYEEIEKKMKIWFYHYCDVHNRNPASSTICRKTFDLIKEELENDN